MGRETQNFTEVVESALEELPQELLTLLDNVAIMIEDWPEDIYNSTADTLYGLYEGVPLTERGEEYAGVLPDRITIFQGPLERDFPSDTELGEQVRITVVHEIAHHFGLDEDRVSELGWA